MADTKRMAAVALLAAVGAARADVSLDLAKAALEPNDAQVTATRPLTIHTNHQTDWPGVTIKPAAAWDVRGTRQLECKIRNVGKTEAEVACRVDDGGGHDETSEPHSMTVRITIKPGQTATLAAPFKPRPPADAPKLFGMRGVPTWAGLVGDKSAIDLGHVTQVVVFSPRPVADHDLVIESLAATGQAAAATMPAQALPFIDTFGQYKHADWPGKTHGLDDLAQRKADEVKDLAAHPQPRDWDGWGGWKDGPTRKATGFFRTEKVEGRWFLIDPDGRLFFSHGIDCVRAGDYTPTTDREAWFENPPFKDEVLKAFVGRPRRAVMGYYVAKDTDIYDFFTANLRRKYGPTYKQDFAALTQQRLRSWGINTIGNWSASEIYLADVPRRLPYTTTPYAKTVPIEGSGGYWGKFPDPFDADFGAAREKALGELKKTLDDPYCIGYFFDNELPWGESLSLATAVLASPAQQPAKVAFVADLKGKYVTIDALNKAWGTRHKSWEDFAAARTVPDVKKADADLAAFADRLITVYFKASRDAVRKVAPNHLYLGCRFAWANDRAVRIAAQYCDVVSYNFYRHSLADIKPPGDVPVLSGEFHFGAIDRGPFHAGLVPVKDQAERAAAYTGYVDSALRHPNFVGTHWFEYIDQPTTGRVLDGENYQIGFVDTADTPYAGLIAASRAVGARLYATRMPAAARRGE